MTEKADMSGETESSQPQEPGETGERDGKGRFVAGNTIGRTGGRPKGVDLLSLVMRERAGTIEQKLLQAIDGIAERAAKGCPQSAKLLFDRICEMQALDVNVNDGKNLVTMPEDERAARVMALISLAQERMAAGIKPGQEPGGTGNTG